MVRRRSPRALRAENVTMPPKAARIDSELDSVPRAKATFIEPMLLMRTVTLPESAERLYELKFDGYRALAVKPGEKVQTRSRNDKDFSYPAIPKGLASLPKIQSSTGSGRVG